MRIIVLLTLILLLNLGFTPDTSASVTGPGAAWQFCRRISLSPVTPTADLQVKVTLAAGQYTNMKSDISDLRFYDINNNLCNYWIETWANTGASTIWVKILTSGTNYLYLYYGNASATATSNGATVFDFFDDFTTALGTNWTTISIGGSVTQSGSTVTLSNTNGGTISLSDTSAFTPSSNSFLPETKHREVGYNRNRFYATTATSGGSPIAVGDYGYFSSSGTAQTSGQVFWGSFLGSTSLSNSTDYLTRWQITDGSTYNWYTLLYSTGVAVTNGSRTTTYGSNIRYICISIPEVANTSTIVDWVRLRKYIASEPVLSVGSQVINISASITAQTNVLCNGQSTGSAKVAATGGTTIYTYLWNSSPTQNTLTASNLPAGTYLAMVTENSIGISASATATITELAAVSASVNGQNNITCNGTHDGTITILASGGAAPYTNSILNGVPTTIYQSSNTFNNIAPGQYKIRVKDSFGCESAAIVP